MTRKGFALLLATAILGITGACDDDAQFVTAVQQVLPLPGTPANSPGGQPNAPGNTATDDVNRPTSPGDAERPGGPDEDPLLPAPGPDAPVIGLPDGPNPDPVDPRSPEGPPIGLWRFVLTQTGDTPDDGVVEFEVEFMVAADEQGRFIDFLRYDAVLSCAYFPPFDLGFDFVKDMCEEDAPILNRRARSCPNSDFSFEINFVRNDFAELTIKSSQPDCPDWGDRQAIVVDASPVQ